MGNSEKSQPDPNKIRPPFPKDKVKKEIDIPAGGQMAKLAVAVPPDTDVYILLTCSGGFKNYLYDLPKPVFRIGTTRSPITGIKCLHCNEGIIGGEIVHKEDSERRSA